MENIVFDTGTREYRINGGAILRFNPSDPNLFMRFLQGADKVTALETELTARFGMLQSTDTPEKRTAAMLEIMGETDKALKTLLTEIFGGENDFHQILSGINLLAVAGNGQRVITNLLQCLQPILVEGAEAYADAKAENALAQAKARRADQGGVGQ
jgi:hypothetical protein